MPFCKTCDDTGAADGTPERPKCPDCYCESCTQAGTSIVGKTDDGKTICEDCVDHIAGHHEPMNVSPQDDPNDD